MPVCPVTERGSKAMQVTGLSVSFLSLFCSHLLQVRLIRTVEIKAAMAIRLDEGGLYLPALVIGFMHYPK